MPNKYRLTKAPYATVDGSGKVAHEIQAVTADGTPIPGRTAIVMIPEAEIAVILAMPHATNPQKTAKNAAYRAKIAQHLGGGWSDNDLTALTTPNGLAATAATGVNTYVTQTLGATFPLDFSLS